MSTERIGRSPDGKECPRLNRRSRCRWEVQLGTLALRWSRSSDSGTVCASACSINSPEHYWSLLGGTASSLGVQHVTEGDQKADLTHLFATDLEGLEEAFGIARAGMQEDGMVWASWPKRSSGVPSQISRSEVMAIGKKVGLVDIKVCAIDDVWSGLKFVIPVADR
ncbi:MAG: hypothetical protein ACOC5M_03885 [Chloroflexota bacterium]